MPLAPLMAPRSSLTKDRKQSRPETIVRKADPTLRQIYAEMWRRACKAARWVCLRVTQPPLPPFRNGLQPVQQVQAEGPTYLLGKPLTREAEGIKRRSIFYHTKIDWSTAAPPTVGEVGGGSRVIEPHPEGGRQRLGEGAVGHAVRRRRGAPQVGEPPPVKKITYIELILFAINIKNPKIIKKQLKI